MDDNNKNKEENQQAPTNIYDNEHPTQGTINLKPETPAVFETQTIEEVPAGVEAPVPEEIVEAEKAAGNEPAPLMFEENRMKYFIIGGGILFFVVVLFIILKFIFTPAPARNVKLTYWGLWEEKEIFQPLIDEYQSKNKNVKIDYIKMSAQDSYREKLIARSNNGQGPDIFRFHNTWKYELKDVLAPLPSNVMATAEFEKTFYKVHQTDLKIGANYYGLPLYIDGLVLIYNDTKLKDIGITQAPSTWEDIATIAKKMNVTPTSSGNLLSGAIAIGTSSNVEHFAEILSLMLVQNGADLRNLDAPEAAQALEIYRKFAEGKSKSWDDSLPNSVNAFAQGKVAMILAPSWEVLVINKMNPDIKIKVVSVPTVPGLPPISIANYWVEGVNKHSKEQFEAWKFLKFLTTADSLSKLYENERKVKLFGEPFSRVDMASKLAQNEYIAPVIKQAPVYVSLPVVARTFDNGLNDAVVQYFANAVNAAAQGTAYDEAMKTAKQGIDQVLKQYGVE